ncbi:MAG: excinuclease ABC subunit UvrC, partial [Candidatus Omnitrophica bacterium]|nr:excinuclease ABC subunit UvrC [Candidatus Omnitrophota bacterium]
MEIREKVNALPTSAGVYIFKDRNGNYLYIGKAGNIRNRVKSHFQNPDFFGKDAVLTKKTVSIDYLITQSAVEALILECNLIKEHKPRYNIMLRDDKSYPYIKIAREEQFPTVYITRDLEDGKAKYFGPYTDAKSLRKTLLLLRKTFIFKTCKKTKIDGKPCLNYHIARCVGPCTGKVSKEDYMEMIENVSMFLSGETQKLLSYLKNRMNEASASKEYEKSAKFRDQIESIHKMFSLQTISKLDGQNQDFIGYARSKNKALIVLFKVRNGKLSAQEKFNLIVIIDSKIEEAVLSFIEQYYSLSSLPPAEYCRAGIPDEIFVPVILKEKNLLEKWLKKTKGKTVKISVPQRGDKKRLLKMASDNAQYKLMEGFSLKSEPINMLTDLKERLNLPSVPFRIEGIDISNIMGKNAVGSVVVFEKGSPKKNEWRKFKIKSIDTSDDYMMMGEIIERRYKRILNEKTKLPDLVLVDGGKGQVNIAKQVFNELGIENMPIVGIAKPVRNGF